MSFFQHVIKIPEAVIIIAQFGELEILGALLASTIHSGAVPWGSKRSMEALALKHPLGYTASSGNCFLRGCHGYRQLHCVAGASQEQLVFHRASSGLYLARNQLLIDSLS